MVKSASPRYGLTLYLIESALNEGGYIPSSSEEVTWRGSVVDRLSARVAYGLIVIGVRAESSG